MTLAAENLGRIVPGASARLLDPESHESIRRVRLAASGVEADPAVSSARSAPILFGVHRWAGVADRTIHFATHRGLSSGTAFEELRGPEAIWFLSALDGPDALKGRSGAGPADPLQPLRAALRAWGSRDQPPRVAVVYTVDDPRGLPKELAAELDADPFASLTRFSSPATVLREFALDQYAPALERTSELLRSFTEDVVPGGRLLVATAQGFGYPLKFCLARVRAASPSRRVGEKSARVLDPLFRALLERPPVERAEERLAATPAAAAAAERFVLLLDSSPEGAPIFERGWAREAYARLSARGPTTTYLLGRSKPVGPAGQDSSEDSPRRPLFRLIGPILEALPEEALALALVGGPVLDLDDFAGTSWKDRLVLVGTGPEGEANWPLTINATEAADLTAAVAMLGPRGGARPG